MPKNDNRNKLKVAAIALALAGFPLVATAAGLGRLTVHSALGQPLQAEIELSASRDELSSLSARVAPVEQFQQQGIDYASALANLRFTLDKRANGDPILRVSSSQPLNEPFLDMLVELNWSTGRLLREYTFLLDPVGHARPVAAIHTPPVVETPKAEPVAEVPKPAEAAKPAVVETPAKPAEPAAAPAAEAPAPAAPAPAAQAAAPAPAAKTHKVKPGETLGKIASETKPEGVSLDQMLVALFSSNQDAFAGNNMNRLKSGKILTVPEKETVAAITPDEAKKTIATQSENFSAYRRKLAALAAEKTAGKEAQTEQGAGGKIAPKVEDQAPTASPSKDRLEVSRSESGKKAAEAERLAKQKSLQETQARAAALEKQNAELQRQNEIAAKLAEAQKQAQAKAEADKADAAAKAAQAAAAKPEDAAKLTVPAQPVEAPKEGDAAAKPAEPPKPKKALPPPEPEPEADFMDEFGTLVYGGAGIVVLLLAWLGIKLRKRGKANETSLDNTPSQFGDGNFSTNSVFGQSGGRSVDTGAASLATDFSHSAPEANASSPEGVDPVAEADVYMAYGRDAQAEEILLDALKTEPGRADVQLKLLEIYASRKSPKAFESIAKDVQQKSGGTGEMWDKVVALGQELDPHNALYGGEAEPVAPAVAEDSTYGATTVVLPSGELARMAQLADSAEQAGAPSDPNAPPPLDFDLDVGEQTTTGAAPALDFELDQSETASAKPAAMPAIDFDLELPDTAVAETAGAAGSSVDFNVDGAAPAGSAVEASLEDTLTRPEAEEAKPAEAAGTSSGDFSFALDTPAADAGPAVDLSAISLDLDQAAAAETPLADALSTPEAVEAAEQNPEVATKLELAQAYEEMGDKEGVRELLQEVLVEGTSAQQEIARQKLAKL